MRTVNIMPLITLLSLPLIGCNGRVTHAKSANAHAFFEQKEVSVALVLKKQNSEQYIESSLHMACHYAEDDSHSIFVDNTIRTPVLKLRDNRSSFQLTTPQCSRARDSNGSVKTRILTDETAPLSSYLALPLDAGVAFSCSVLGSEIHGFWILLEKSHLQIFPFKFLLSTDLEQHFEKVFK